MSDKVFPERSNVGQLRRLAKELRTAARAGDAVAVERVRSQVDADPSTVSLSTSQLVIAREHGFASWPRLIEQLANRRPGLGGLAGLAFARVVAAGELEVGQTVVLAGRVVSVEHDEQDRDRVRLVVVPTIGSSPGEAPDPREIVIVARRDARLRVARRLSPGERRRGPGLTSGEDHLRLAGEIPAGRAQPSQILVIAAAVAQVANADGGERVRLVLRDPDWGELDLVCPADMELSTARRTESRGLTFEKAIIAERLAPGEIVTLDGHVMSASIDPEDPERIRLVLVAALGVQPGEPPDQRELVISCPRDMPFGTAVPRNIQLAPLRRR
jgi:hypothetical protein